MDEIVREDGWISSIIEAVVVSQRFDPSSYQSGSHGKKKRKQEECNDMRVSDEGHFLWSITGLYLGQGRSVFTPLHFLFCCI